MRTLMLGKTGLTVPELGFGGIPITRLSLDEGVGVVRHAFEKGIRFFDTANAYADSESKIGQALESVRGKVVLATKTLARDAEKAAANVEKSLASLRASTIDLYQLHQVANDETLEKVLSPGGAYEALDKARGEGKIRFIGFSSHNMPTAIKVCRTGLFATVQFPFNFVETEHAEELFAVAREMDMGIIAMKPLGGGMLERADLCFRFMQQYPHVLPIPGMESKAEVDELVGLYESPRPPTDAEWEEIRRIRSELGKRFCHRCEYCMPCEQGVNIPGALVFRSISKRFPPSIAILFSGTNVESAEKCTECGECMERCPYHLPIPDLLKEHLSLFREFSVQHGK